MAFSNSSFFAGVGVAFAAIAVGFAGGAMITTGAIQPPNRLERVNSAAAVPAKSDAPNSHVASSTAEPSNPTNPPAQEAPPSAVAAAPAPPVDSHVQAAASEATKFDGTSDAKTAAKTDGKTEAKPETKFDAATNIQPQPARAKNPASPPAAKNEVTKNDDSAPVKSERANARSADFGREATRKRAEDRRFSDDRKFSERRRQQDRDERRLDEASNVVRQMPRDGRAGQAVDQDPPPRFGGRSRPYQVYEDDDAPARVVSEPPPRFFGLFGN